MKERTGIEEKFQIPNRVNMEKNTHILTQLITLQNSKDKEKILKDLGQKS